MCGSWTSWSRMTRTDICRAAAASALRRFGFQESRVHEAESGNEALQKVLSLQDVAGNRTPLIIFLNMRMLGSDGAESARIIVSLFQGRRLLREPFLVCASSNRTQHADHHRLFHASVPRTFELERLRHMLDQCHTWWSQGGGEPGRVLLEPSLRSGGGAATAPVFGTSKHFKPEHSNLPRKLPKRPSSAKRSIADSATTYTSEAWKSRSLDSLPAIDFGEEDQPEKALRTTSDGVLARPGNTVESLGCLLPPRPPFEDVKMIYLVGRGSFGRVYRARWDVSTVALKVVEHYEKEPHALMEFEGSLSATLAHPNLVQTFKHSIRDAHGSSSSRADARSGALRGSEVWIVQAFVATNDSEKQAALTAQRSRHEVKMKIVAVVSNEEALKPAYGAGQGQSRGAQAAWRTSFEQKDGELKAFHEEVGNAQAEVTSRMGAKKRRPETSGEAAPGGGNAGAAAGAAAEGAAGDGGASPEGLDDELLEQEAAKIFEARFRAAAAASFRGDGKSGAAAAASGIGVGGARDQGGAVSAAGQSQRWRPAAPKSSLPGSSGTDGAAANQPQRGSSTSEATGAKSLGSATCMGDKAWEFIAHGAAADHDYNAQCETQSLKSLSNQLCQSRKGYREGDKGRAGGTASDDSREAGEWAAVSTRMHQGRKATRGILGCASVKVLGHKVCAEISSAASYLHSRGIIHGDLTTSNVLLMERRCPKQYVTKVTDFGLARVLDNGASKIDTATMGTVTYMPPELFQLEGSALTKKVDVYAFGVITWQLCTSRTIPFEGLQPTQVVVTVAGGATLELPQDVPAPLAKVYQQCVSRNPEARPSFDTVVQKLLAMFAVDEASYAN
ncbi:unnamed protein product [Prorocentrum cordatum]|uniref:Protein kinase domain-containing protein n=1 Tax=Prorocentrum cordatum TaxID=2364126 RepID=A0ABN9XF98_9DINO|nr:unnamed protein product [Polarella glacialis]